MTAKRLPAQEMLLQLLRYEPETGKLFWRHRPAALFTSGRQTAEHNAASWNGKNAGKEAFTACSCEYRVGRLGDDGFFAHRVIWKMIYGDEPDQIDHIDGNRANNRIWNLRSATDAVNSLNKAIPSNNTSGFIGVHWEPRRKHWRAVIQVGRKQKHIGSFPTAEAASIARKEAQREHGYHENHGRAPIHA